MLGLTQLKFCSGLSHLCSWVNVAYSFLFLYCPYLVQFQSCRSFVEWVGEWFLFFLFAGRVCIRLDWLTLVEFAYKTILTWGLLCQFLTTHLISKNDYGTVQFFFFFLNFNLCIQIKFFLIVYEILSPTFSFNIMDICFFKYSSRRWQSIYFSSGF